MVMSLDLNFLHDGQEGRVSIACVPNDDPLSVGTTPEAAGFPMCTATIVFPTRGYRALFGWVQLVRSTDNAFTGSAFEIDPLDLFKDSPAPYCWYGINPTLFDAPWRSARIRLDWIAHSFLAVTPRNSGKKRVVPLLGFSWGFIVDNGGSIAFSPIQLLPKSAWDSHVPYLQQCYPGWTFSDGGIMI